MHQVQGDGEGRIMTRVEASIMAMNASAAKVYIESGRPHEGLHVINDLLEYLRPQVDQRADDDLLRHKLVPTTHANVRTQRYLLSLGQQLFKE